MCSLGNIIARNRLPTTSGGESFRRICQTYRQTAQRAGFATMCGKARGRRGAPPPDNRQARTASTEPIRKLMDLGLTDKIVVVTGASKGIGFACAAAFAAEGARVVLVSRSRANLDAAIARLPHAAHVPAAIVANLVQADQAQHMVEKAERDHGAIDVLVNSAGAA